MAMAADDPLIRFASAVLYVFVEEA
jgi:hypothetical protein